MKKRGVAFTVVCSSSNMYDCLHNRGDGKSTQRRALCGPERRRVAMAPALETTGAHDWTVTGWLMQELAQKGHFAALQIKVFVYTQLVKFCCLYLLSFAVASTR